MKRCFLLLLGLLCFGAWPQPNSHRLTGIEIMDWETLGPAPITEPSALAGTHSPDTWILVGDEGDVSLWNPYQGELETTVFSGDWESIHFDGLAWFLWSEQESKLHRLESLQDRPRTLWNLARESMIPRDIRRAFASSEALTIVPDTSTESMVFLLASQEPSWNSGVPLLEVELDPEGELMGWALDFLPLNEVSEMVYYFGDLYVLSDLDQRLFRFDSDLRLQESIPVPGRNPEGLYVDWEKILVVDERGDIFVKLID